MRRIRTCPIAGLLTVLSLAHAQDWEADARAFGQILLSQPGHIQSEDRWRGELSQAALEIIQKMQQAEKEVKFSFLGDEVVYQNKTLKELRDWEWSERFTNSGIQRLEFVDEVLR
jgi:hypothetical protein